MPVQMRYVEYGTVATEEESLMTVNPLAPKTWTFGDKTQVNKWGNTRAYKLGLDANPSAVVDADHYSMPAFSYAKQMLAVRHGLGARCLTRQAPAALD
eukprot:6202305-Pleurochrysis_carterae.AAC.1